MKSFTAINLVLLAFGCFAETTANSAPKLIQSPANNFYYVQMEQKYNWHAAVVECHRYNMTLLTIDSAAKSNDVEEVLKTLIPGFPQYVTGMARRCSPVFYIGGYDLADFRNFVWEATGLPFEYTNWAREQPNNAHQRNQRCVNIGYYGNVKWNDIRCERRFGFICE